MSLHCGEQRLGEFGRDDRDKLALVGDVERVEAEKLAGRGDFGGAWESPLPRSKNRRPTDARVH